MRWRSMLPVLLFAVAVSTAAQRPVARDHLLLGNELVGVYGLEVPPRYAAPLYQNSHDIFWIAVDAGWASFAGEEGATTLELNSGDVRLFRSFRTKSVANNSGATFHAVIVQIKRRALTSEACYCTDRIESAICGCGAAMHLPALWATGMGKIMLAGTTLAPGQSFEHAAHRNAVLLVALTPLQLRDGGTEDSLIDLKAGEVRWLKEGWYKFKNAGAGEARFVTLEF